MVILGMCIRRSVCVCKCVSVHFIYIYVKLCVCLFCDASFKKNERNVALNTKNGAKKIECVFEIYVQENLRGICNLSQDISL